MPAARLTVLPPAAVAQWRRARAAAGTPLPEADGADRLEALELVVDDVAVGGVVLTYAGPRASIRLLETTLPGTAAAHWRAAIAAIEQHAAEHGARSVVTAVPVGRVAPFREAGWLAVLAGVASSLEGPQLMKDTGQVTVRPMTDDERRAFAADAADLLRAGMTRAGVVDGPDAPLGELGDRLVRIAQDPAPEDEWLMSGVVDGVQVGRFWATLERRGTGLGLLSNSLDLFPEHRGRGLTRHFVAALGTRARAEGLIDVRGRLYGHDARARRSLTGAGMHLDEVHLRKDL